MIMGSKPYFTSWKCWICLKPFSPGATGNSPGGLPAQPSVSGLTPSHKMRRALLPVFMWRQLSCVDSLIHRKSSAAHQLFHFLLQFFFHSFQAQGDQHLDQFKPTVQNPNFFLNLLSLFSARFALASFSGPNYSLSHA